MFIENLLYETLSNEYYADMKTRLHFGVLRNSQRKDEMFIWIRLQSCEAGFDGIGKPVSQ